MKKVILDEIKICKEYQTTRDGVEVLAKKYHVGKIRIKSILKSHNIEFKKQGKQELMETFLIKDWRIEKYPTNNGETYIAIDKNNGFTTQDYLNRGGVLTTHIKNSYNVEVLSLYERRKYYMLTGNYWWEQWFDIILKEKTEIKKCPYCNWETIDIENKSGWFEQHLSKEHKMNLQSYLREFPNDITYFKHYARLKKREERLSKETEYVICPLCLQRFNKITEAHIFKVHNLTWGNFKTMHPNIQILSQSAVNQAKHAISLGNLTVSKERFVSSYEKEIQFFLKDNNIDFSPNRQILIGKEIDLLIEDFKIGIEFDGLKFHTEFFGRKAPNYHLDKTLKCNEKGYALIHIFEDEYVNHKDAVYEKLKHFLHINNEQKIYGRKCVIKFISQKQTKEFNDKYSLQEFQNSDIYLGAFFEDNLIGIMSFNKDSGDVWKITNFVTDYNYVMCGVGSKLFKHFSRTINPKCVYATVDRRWVLSIRNNFYTKIGFTFDSFIDCDFRYYNERIERYKRFTKQELNTMNISKKQVEEFDRIWDCGMVKYVYKF